MELQLDDRRIRYGAFPLLAITINVIDGAVRSIGPGEAASATIVPRRSEPNVCLELSQAIEAEGPFGIRREVRILAIAADDETGFRRALGGE